MVEIVENFLMSKKGGFDGGEDRLITGPNFYGVSDGATDKTGLNWGTKDAPKSGGHILSDIIKDYFQSEESKNASPEKAIDQMNKKVQEAAKKANIDISIVQNRAAAVFMVYNVQKSEIWHIGGVSYGTIDAKGVFRQHRFDPPIDRLMGKIRASFSEWYMKEGGDPFEGGRDRGREFIDPFLRRKQELQNIESKGDEVWLPGIPKKMVAYRVINGFPAKVDVFSVPSDIREIIFATDGIGVIRPTWDHTRKAWLKQLKADPHHIHLLKATKGMASGNKNFDDMAYLKIKI
jgi:hypothetical protein